MQFKVHIESQPLHREPYGWGWAYRVVVQSRESDWDAWVEYDRSNLFDHLGNAEVERKLLYELYCQNPPQSLRGVRDRTVDCGPPVSV